jgi:membrane protease subunit HflK
MTPEPSPHPTLSWSFQRTAWFAVWIAAGLAIVYVASGIYSVDSSEVGVLLRFGRVADAAVPPGIHYALPWPIDRVVRVPVRNVRRLKVDDFHGGSVFASNFWSMTGLSSYLVTGDNNIVTVSCVLQYSILDPAKYLFSLTSSESTLRSLAANTLTHTLAALSIDDILTTGKTGIQLSVKQDLQRRLDELDSGLAVSFVELQDVRPPTQVQAQFNDVINAKIDQDKMINNAISYRNESIPKAKAESDRLLRQAEAYRQRVVARSEGDSQRFLARVAEYSRAPAVTRRRLHHELLAEVLPRLEQTTVVGRDDSGPLVRVVGSPRTK